MLYEGRMDMTQELNIRRVEKIIFMIFIILFVSKIHVFAMDEFEYNDIKDIEIYYSAGRNGIPINLSEEQSERRNFSYYSENSAEITYILHYLNSFDLIDDGRVVYGADVSVGNVSMKYVNNSSDIIRFFSQRFVDKNGKQYGMDNDEYNRFLDFVYALKKKRILLKDEITFEPSEWAKYNIKQAVNDGLLPKWNQIDYTNDIMRLEVCQLMENLLNKNGYIDESLEQLPFLDTNDKSVKLLWSMNIVSGKSETEFYPYDYITREEFSRILSEAYKQLSKNDLSDLSALQYKDKEQISDWAFDSVKEVTSLGLMQGDENGNFNPKDNITKEQVIVTLLRLHNLN